MNGYNNDDGDLYSNGVPSLVHASTRSRPPVTHADHANQYNNDDDDDDDLHSGATSPTTNGYQCAGGTRSTRRWLHPNTRRQCLQSSGTYTSARVSARRRTPGPQPAPPSKPESQEEGASDIMVSCVSTFLIIRDLMASDRFSSNTIRRRVGAFLVLPSRVLVIRMSCSHL